MVAHAGVDAFRWTALGEKVILPLVLSPAIGFVVAFFLMIGLMWVAVLCRPATVQRGSRRLHLVSAAAMGGSASAGAVARSQLLARR
ncbi:MAG: hypothetical protein ABIP94_00635 [Planctomycetota bacterium]